MTTESPQTGLLERVLRFSLANRIAVLMFALVLVWCEFSP